jgi:regulator of nucleoside diphosphate kinase
MTERAIYITEFDLQRLKRLLQQTDGFNNPDKKYLKDLERELDRATVVDPAAVPASVVTMNSKVRFKDLESGDETVYTIVFPEESNVGQGKISVVAPIGTALLGYKVGDTVEWKVPAGYRRLQIKEVIYQPEAAGHFHL